MLAQHKNDCKLFTFPVRGFEGPQLSGCVPRSIIQAEPNSAPAHTYNDKWGYATDDKSRAVINSNPAHWPMIQDWLSFGTVPKDPSGELISQCRYWQLDRLLAAIEAQSKGSKASAIS